MVEILSPAGDLDRLKWALTYGADAVYIGGYDYSLRANANNFSLTEIKEAVDFAHNMNKKVYVTVNIIMHNEDLEKLDEYLKNLNEAGIDAYIVSDLAVIKRIKDLKLKPEIHISTQESTVNKEAVKFWEKLGVSRVVLGRECSKEDIKDIKENTKIELEVFIHGAMCTSYSGRCVLSNYVTKRDSNRGGCSQVCRFSFDIDDSEDFQICTKDLCMIDYIGELIDIGVASLKIEGRMRSLYYIATVVNAYKQIVTKKIDGTLNQETLEYYKKVLRKVSNRENSVQFYDREPGVNEQYYTGRQEVSNQDFLGIIIDYKEGYATFEQRNNFKVGETVEIFGPNKEAKKFIVEEIKNKDGEEVKVAAHPQEILKLKVPFEVQKNDIIRIPIS
ncbi:MAG: U32 family peptidase [Bacilli bacterium]|nr:U32 family peptidase [Bacilli bacterium]